MSNLVIGSSTGSSEVSTIAQMMSLDQALMDRESYEVLSGIINRDPYILLVPNSFGSFPIHVAITQKACIEIVRLMILLNPNCCLDTNAVGSVALHVAVIHGASIDVVKLLYYSEPSTIFKANSSGNLPIHLAAMNSTSNDIVSFVVSKYIEGCRIPNNGGFLPLHCALYFCMRLNSLHSRGNIDCIFCLVKAYPMAIITSTISGGTPLDFCFNFRLNDVVTRIILGGCTHNLSSHDVKKFHNLNWLARRPCLLWYYKMSLVSRQERNDETDQTDYLEIIFRRLRDFNLSAKLFVESPLLRHVVTYL